MDEIGQLRIYVSERHFPIYHTMGKTLFAQNSEFFMLCVLTGHRIQLRMEVPKKQELCRAITLTENDWVSLRSLYYGEIGELGAYKQLTQLAEQYAFAGLTHLIEEEMQDLIYQSDEGIFHLKDNPIELQLLITEYVIKQKEEVPF